MPIEAPKPHLYHSINLEVTKAKLGHAGRKATSAAENRRRLSHRSTSALKTGVGSGVLASQSRLRKPSPACAIPYRKYWFWLEV